MPTSLAQARTIRRRDDLRRHARWAYVIAAAALLLGAMLLPKGDELLLIHVRNHDVSRARQVLADGANQGVSTAASVVAHGELFLFEGRVDEAITEMEAYAAARPDDQAAWAHLAALYQNAQRLHDRVRALANVYRLAPSDARARELAALYRRIGDERAEALVLWDLTTAGRPNAGESMRSARLEAALGRPDRARQVLDGLRRHDPRAFDYPVLEFHARLLSEAGKKDLLAKTLQPLPLVREDPELLANLASAMKTWGDSDGALALLEPLPGLPPVPDLLAALARTAQGTAHAPRILATLASIDQTQPLAADPLRATVSLALTVPDYDAVEGLLTRPGRTLEPVTIAYAIGQAVASGARDRAQQLIALVGDSSLSESPILALDLAIERNDLSGADRWIAFVDAHGPLTPEQVAAVAQYETRLGRDVNAYARLVALARSGRAPVWALTDLTAAAVTVGRVDDTLAVLDRLAPTSPEARAAWAQLAAQSRKTALIEAWIRSGSPRADDGPALRDVVLTLSAQGETALAAEAAGRLYASTRRADEGLLLGQMLLAADKPLDALDPLRPLRATNADAALAFDSALHAARAAGADVTRELKTVFGSRLRDGRLPEAHRAMLLEGLWLAGERASIYDDVIVAARRDLDRWLSPLVESAQARGDRDAAIALVSDALGPASEPATPRRETLLHALLDLDASHTIVIPHLERFAAEKGGTWVYAYDERLAAAGRTAERIALWTTVGSAAAASPDERRAAAARLHELGASLQAAALIKPLAASAGPEASDVESLLFFWGPNPSVDDRAWLASRLREAPAPDQPGWFARLVNVGGARDAVAAVPSLPAEASTALVDAWVTAHRATNDRRLLRAALESVLSREAVSVESLRAAGRTALAEGLSDLAHRAFAAVAERRPDDIEAMRWLGVLSFYAGRTTEAGVWLDAYRAAGGDDPEPLYQLGELARLDRDDVRARAYFTRALRRLTVPDVPPNAALHANLLVRLDRRDDATAAFESLLAADPALDHVRADYVVALFQWGEFDRARRVLDRAAADASGNAATVSADASDRSGVTRLDLLRLQWLNVAGRYGQALAVLEQLAARVPSDPDVLVARALFDRERGRPEQADAAYDRARRLAPDRDDIARLLADRERSQAPHADLRSTSRSIRNGWRTDTTALSFDTTIAPYTTLAFAAETVHLSAPVLLGTDGAVRTVDIDKTRVDAGLTMPIATGTTATASFFAASGGAGGGVTLTRHDLFGRTSVTAEFGRPFWEFPESTADNGRRDRVGVERQFRLGADTSAWILAGGNRYRLASGASLSSASFTFGVVRQVRRVEPTLTLQYGLDVERRLRADVAVTTDGRIFTPVPLSSREVHVIGAISRFTAALWTVEAAAGYTIDRLGGRGSFVTGRMTPSPLARLGVELWAERRLYLLSTAQHEFQAGAALKVRF